MREIEQVDNPLDRLALRDLGAAHARQEQQLFGEVGGAMPMAPDQQVLQHGRVLEQLDVLERARDAALRHMMRRAGDRLSLEQDAARGRRVDEADQVEDRGLAGAVRPDDGVDLALVDRKAHTVDRDHAAETHAEIFDREEAHRSRSERR